MRIREAKEYLQTELNGLYSIREIDQLNRIIWEDLFNQSGILDRALHTKEIKVYKSAVEKLKQYYPIQYITGITHFYGLKLFVNEHVLIPRPETEELVHLFLEHTSTQKAKVLDIGTGSACIALSIKNKRPGLELWAIDKSKEAIKLAKKNVERYELNLKLVEMDFLDERINSQLTEMDYIISNPPYISKNEKGLMSRSTLKYEPEMALFPYGNDPLLFYKKIAAFAESKLNDKGQIFLECNEFLIKQTANIFKKDPFSNVKIEKDLQGKSRFLIITK